MLKPFQQLNDTALLRSNTISAATDGAERAKKVEAQCNTTVAAVTFLAKTYSWMPQLLCVLHCHYCHDMRQDISPKSIFSCCAVRPNVTLVSFVSGNVKNEAKL